MCDSGPTDGKGGSLEELGGAVLAGTLTELVRGTDESESKADELVSV